MAAVDILWTVIWFFVGLLTFQVSGLKRLLESVSGAISGISLLILITKPDPITTYLTSIPIGYVAGDVTLLAYLIGANISRAIQFGKMSPRIILYVVAFFLVLLIAKSLQ
jgi:hypothetical protein